MCPHSLLDVRITIRHHHLSQHRPVTGVCNIQLFNVEEGNIRKGVEGQCSRPTSATEQAIPMGKVSLRVLKSLEHRQSVFLRREPQLRPLTLLCLSSKWWILSNSGSEDDAKI